MIIFLVIVYQIYLCLIEVLQKFPYLIEISFYSHHTILMKKVYIIFLACCLSVGCTSTNTSNQGYYDISDFSTVPKIDTHVHIRTERADFADQANKDQFQLVNIVVDGASAWEDIYDQYTFATAQQTAHSKQYRTISSFSVEGFHEEEWSKQVIQWLDSTFEEGSIGIKVWKNIGMVLQDSNDSFVMLDDPRLDEIFDYLVQENKIVIGHLGEPLNCWLPLDKMTTNNDHSYFSEHPEYHMYKHPDLPSYEDQMRARDNRLDKHPELRFVGAHMASIEWSVDTLGAWLSKYPTASIDLAARMGQVFYQTKEDPEKVRAFFTQYQDQIMYATDMGDRGASASETLPKRMHDTWLRDWQYFTTDDRMNSDLIDGEFQGIQLPKAVVDKIFFGNAAAVFGF